MWELLLAAALRFPDVDARTLEGQAVRTASLQGAPAVVALGFGVESRREVEPWVRRLAQETKGALRIVIMPVYQGLPGPVRTLVDGAMARAMPAEARPHVWTTAAHAAIVGGLDLGREQTVIVLVDATGEVRYVARGAVTEPAARRLIELWRAMKPAERRNP